MRNPFHVGRWVRGRNHYGRRMLIESLMESRAAATWVVGTRRLGKTSLLRQMELLAKEQGAAARAKGETPDYIPIYWDLQGCETPDDLAYELDLALDDGRTELETLGIALESLPSGNAVTVLRSLGRMVDERNARVLLLIDEAEALLAVARHDAPWLGTLRKALLEGHIRTVLTSTRLLSKLNHLNTAWNTSPFLFGFQLVNLWALGPEMAMALVRQAQLGAPPGAVQVDDELLARILAYCNGHPYLLQYLCERLFVAGPDGRGALRPIQEQDLHVDHLLAGFFMIDFHNMTRVERRTLLTVSSMTLASERELLNALYDIPPERVRMFLYGLLRLGYLRNIKGQWAIGNEFLRRWLIESYDELCRRTDSALDEAEEENHLRDGARDEAARLRRKIEQVQQELDALQRQMEDATGPAREQLRRRVRALREELARLRRELQRVAGPDLDGMG